MGTSSVRERVKYYRENKVDTEDFLVDVGAVEAFEGDEELRFTDDFADRVGRHIGPVRKRGVQLSDIARLFGVEQDEIEPVERDYPTYKIIRTIRRWPSDASMVLDVAADLAFREMTDRWERVPPRQRFEIVQSLRSFHENCPECDGELAITSEPVTSCCSDRDVVALRCTECHAHYIEFHPSEFGFETDEPSHNYIR